MRKKVFFQILLFLTSGKTGIKERITIIAKKPKMLISALLAVVLIITIAVGCTFTGAKNNGEQPIDSRGLELLIDEQKAQIEQYKKEIDEQKAQIEQYKKEYDLRNILDIKARQILTALNSGEFSETEEDLLNENVVIEEDRLVFFFDNYSNEVLFFQNKLNFERVRQRFFCLDEQGRFITGYEFYMLSDDIEGIGNRGVLVFTFIEEPSGWKLADIGKDR